MKNLVVLGSMLFAVGCGLSETQYATDYLDGLCAKWEECVDGFDAELFGCSGATEDGAEDGGDAPVCDYDAKQAQTCIDDIDAVTCDEDNVMGFDIPSSCSSVYTNCT